MVQRPGPVQASQFASHAPQTVSALPPQAVITYLPVGQLPQVPQVVLVVAPQAAV